MGGGPSISASCGRLFSNSGMQVALAARNPKRSNETTRKDFDVRLFRCDGSQVDDVGLFERIENEMGSPRLVVHNIDGRHKVDGTLSEIIRKDLVDADPEMVFETIKNSAFSAF